MSHTIAARWQPAFYTIPTRSWVLGFAVQLALPCWPRAPFSPQGRILTSPLLKIRKEWVHRAPLRRPCNCFRFDVDMHGDAILNFSDAGKQAGPSPILKRPFGCRSGYRLNRVEDRTKKFLLCPHVVVLYHGNPLDQKEMKSAKKRMSCIVFRKPGFSGWHAAASSRRSKISRVRMASTRSNCRNHPRVFHFSFHQGTGVADRVANAVARINRKAKKVGSTERGGRALDRKHTAGREGGLFEWFGWYESEKGLPCSSKPTYQAFKHLP